jgi:hypothetical protein
LPLKHCSPAPSLAKDVAPSTTLHLMPPKHQLVRYNNLAAELLVIRIFDA